MAGDSVQDHGIVQVGIQKVGLRLKKNVFSAFEHSVKVHCAQFRRGSKIFKRGPKGDPILSKKGTKKGTQDASCSTNKEELTS